MRRVKHKEDVFYGLLADFGHKIAEVGQDYATLVRNYPQSRDLVAKMKAYEVDCDHHVAKILTELYGSFVTPFDREDIAMLARTMDGVVDQMEGASRRFELFRVEEMHPEAIRMADLTASACVQLGELFDHLPNFHKDPVVMERVRSVGTLEDEGDVVYRGALGDLFAGTDPMETLKWVMLLERMEAALDCCKSVGNIVQGVVVKNA